MAAARDSPTAKQMERAPVADANVSGDSMIAFDHLLVVACHMLGKTLSMRSRTAS